MQGHDRWRSCDGRAATKDTDNEHLKLALLGSLRIAFFSFLKVALCAYTLFLSDTAFAGTAREGNGQASDAVSYGPPEGNSNANMARRNAMLQAARARP
jgi:hypothetical protein